MQKVALIISGIVFGLLAVSHAIRWLVPIEILIDGNSLPFLISLFTGILFALLSIWMFISAKKMGTSLKKDKMEQNKVE